MEPPSSLLADLRTATAPAHRALEASLDIERACAHAGRYRTLLGRFLGLYEPLEAGLRAAHGRDARGFDLSGREKMPWLLRDLGALGLSSYEIHRLPRCAHAPDIDGAGASWGVAYVLEGATLGGRRIVEMLRGGPTPERGRNFFASYGPAIGERWRAFCARLEAFDRGGPDRAAAVGAAVATFEAFENWVGHPLPA